MAPEEQRIPAREVGRTEGPRREAQPRAMTANHKGKPSRQPIKTAKASAMGTKSRNNLNSYIYQPNSLRPSTAFLSLGRKPTEVAREGNVMAFFINGSPTKQMAPRTTQLAHRDQTLKQRGFTPKHDKDFEKYRSVAQLETEAKARLGAQSQLVPASLQPSKTQKLNQEA